MTLNLFSGKSYNYIHTVKEYLQYFLHDKVALQQSDS